MNIMIIIIIIIIIIMTIMRYLYSAISLQLNSALQ